jgi:predicted porin
LTNSGFNSSRLGFRGVEDLGGGLNASFHLEAGVNNDDGSLAGTNVNNQALAADAPGVRAGSQGLTFNRRSTVSLGGGFGEVRLGRDYTPQFWNHTVYDAFGTNGVGTSVLASSLNKGGPTFVRASNSIGYFLPGNLGGFNGQLQYSMGENASTGTKDGNGYGLRFGYGAGPIAANVAYSRTTYAAGNITTTNVGASYDFGVAKIMGLYDQDKNGTVTGKGFNVGVTAPLGAGEIRAAFSTYKVVDVKANKIAVGYIHNLSKRTAAYATLARVSNSGGATQALNGASTSANGSSTGYDFGIRHSF